LFQLEQIWISTRRPYFWLPNVSVKEDKCALSKRSIFVAAQKLYIQLGVMVFMYVADFGQKGAQVPGTEWHFFQDMFFPLPWNESSFAQSCQDRFGVTPRPDWVPSYYGGVNITPDSGRKSPNIHQGVTEPCSLFSFEHRVEQW
jgi:hypothetical protein